MKQQTYWQLRNWQFRWIPLAKSDWTDNWGNVKRAKTPDTRDSKCYNWAGTGKGPLGGYTAFEMMGRDCDATYGVAPAVPATSGKYGFAVVDVDCTEDIPKHDLKAMPIAEARQAVDDFIEDLMRRMPWMKSKLICRYRTGSGIGVHLWYQHHDPIVKMRKALPFGDLITGAYVALYEPETLLQGLQASNIENVAPGEMRQICRKTKKTEPEIQEPEIRHRTGRTYEMNADSIHADLGPQQGIGLARAVQMMQGIFDADDPQSDDGRFRWTPSDIAKQLGCFSIEYWDDHRFWLAAGMALHDISNDPGTRDRMFEVWTEFSRMSHKYDPGHQARAWRAFSRNSDGDRITMGTITRLARRQHSEKQYEKKDLTALNEWLASNVALDAGTWTTPAMAYEHYSKNNDAAEAPKTFAKAFNAWCKDNNAIAKRRKGYSGWQIRVGPAQQKPVHSGLSPSRALARPARSDIEQAGRASPRAEQKPISVETRRSVQYVAWCRRNELKADSDASWLQYVRTMPTEEKPEAGIKRSARNWKPEIPLITQIMHARVSPLAMLVIDEMADAVADLDANQRQALADAIDYDYWMHYKVNYIDRIQGVRLQLRRIWNEHRKEVRQ